MRKIQTLLEMSNNRCDSELITIQGNIHGFLNVCQIDLEQNENMSNNSNRIMYGNLKL